MSWGYVTISSVGVRRRGRGGYKAYIPGWVAQNKGCLDLKVTERIVISLSRLGF